MEGQGSRQIEELPTRPWPVQLRSGKIGFNYFLYRIRVPGVLSPACQCGWREQDSKHITLFYPDYAEGRAEIFRKAGTECFGKIISTKEGVRAAARQIVRADALHQFSLARLQARRVDRSEEEVQEQGQEKERIDQVVDEVFLAVSR